MVTPDSLEWWCTKAQEARDKVRENPDSDNCCLYALAVGRCRLLGKNFNWSFSTKRALSAASRFIVMINDYRSNLTDIHWLVKVWPDELKQISQLLVSRRIDILSVQVFLDLCFSEIEVRYEEDVKETTDDIVNALLDLDTEFEGTLPVLKKLGKADKVLEYYKTIIDKKFHDQWWLVSKVRGKTK